MSTENGKIIGLMPRPEPKEPGFATQIVQQAIENAPQAVSFLWGNIADHNIRAAIARAAKTHGVKVSVKKDKDGKYLAFVPIERQPVAETPETA